MPFALAWRVVRIVWPYFAQLSASACLKLSRHTAVMLMGAGDVWLCLNRETGQKVAMKRWNWIEEKAGVL